MTEKPEENFSLAIGGLFYRFQQCLGLLGPDLPPMRTATRSATRMATTSTAARLTGSLFPPPAGQAVLVAGLYDSQTRSMLQTDVQFASIGSQQKGLAANTNGSVDVYFGPKAPAGKESNWVPTVRGKSWNALFRLYGPLEPFFNKPWRPGEIELVK